MRIVSGNFRGKRLKTLEGENTRPTTDKVKESLFNIIGPYFDEDRVLDLFSGSGNLALEAISRGCSEAICVDMNKGAVSVIKENISSIKKEDSMKVLQMDYKKALKKLSNEKFDIVFLDPPYKMDVYNEIIETLVEQDMLNPYALVVCESLKEVDVLNPVGFSLFKDNSYGITRIKIFEYGDNNE
jgi:16S rRNA (guanine966-N2)-methyltransferase